MALLECVLQILWRRDLVVGHPERGEAREYYDWHDGTRRTCLQAATDFGPQSP